jgi:Mg-chelatase subunit ChlD
MPSALFASFALPLVALGAAAAAAAVPVLIHLLSRQRYQVVPWAAVQFLLAAQKRHKRRIDRWLLLALRVLALLLPLAGMCAATDWAERAWQTIRPAPLEAASNAPRTHHIIVLDASLSMTAVGGGGTRYERAVGQIEALVRGSNPGDGFTLIHLAGTAHAVIPGPAADPEKVLLELRNLKPTHGTCDYPSALTLVADTVARSPRNYPRRQVTVFTDLQRSAWNPVLPADDTTAPDAWQRILPRADFAVIDLAGSDADNLSVADVTLADPLALADARNAVVAVIQNHGKTDRRGVRVELLLGRPTAAGDAAPVPVESRVIDVIGSGQRVSVPFILDGPAKLREPGPHLLQVKLSDSDDLSADDVRTLAVEVRESIPCLLVNGKPASDPFRRASEYLQTALDPAVIKLPTGNPARPRTVSAAEFADAAFTDLSAVDCVFLCDVPTLTAAQVARLDAHLKRGGGVVIGLGPNAADNLARYNDLLFDNGNGLLPGKLTGVRKVTAPDDPGFRLYADDKAYTQDPLAAFRSDNARAGLADVPFRQYVRMDAPEDGRGRRILSFVPARPPVLKPGELPEKRDPAVVEMPRHRGRVIVYTSSFNQDWTDWPVLPSFLPMAHELLRFAATNPDRHTVRAGEALEEFFPVTAVGLKAVVHGPDGLTADVPVAAGDEAGVARFSDTALSGLYRVGLAGKPPHFFAVNVPDATPGGGSESDLTRIDPRKLTDIAPQIQVVGDPVDARFESAAEGQVVLTPRPWGPTVARWLLSLALVLLVVEVWYAWRVGPSRSLTAGVGNAEQTAVRSRWRWVWAAVSLVPLAVAAVLLLTVAHDGYTGRLLGFLPDDWRQRVEAALGVPAAGPGEGTRWRLEAFAVYLKSFALDRWLLAGLVGVGVAIVAGLYALERRAAGRFRRIVLPGLLRVAAVLLLGFVLLPQLRLAFDRESWPDVVVMLDTSASMATSDQLQDPAVQAKARELMTAANVPEADRLRLAKLLLTRNDGDWLTRLLSGRQVKVHVYTMADQARLVAEMTEPNDLAAGREAVAKLTADGESSRLGDAVQAVLKAFRGGSLSAIVAFTDGVVTSGDDLPKAAREAARSNVPLYLVGLGDSYDPPDLALADLKADDVVLKDDQLLFEARLTARGPNPPATVPVILSELQGDKRVERSRQTVTVDPSGKPVVFKLTHTPTEAGEKAFVIEVPVQPGETETLNNRMERTVLVTESKKLKVLMVEGYPRYEYRFVKAQLERETEQVRGNRAIELDVLLLDASNGHWQSDKSAERLRGATPTRSQLFEYDVVIFGDVNPGQIAKANQFFTDLVEFVKAKGGGLLVVAGEHATPHKLYDTPLGELLPVTPTDESVRTGGPPPTPADAPLTEPYLPQPTPLGRTHPLFRFVPDEVENAKVWEGLKPFYWTSGGWRRKGSAEVLAVHPSKPPEGGDTATNHPIVLQHFVGAGRVVFFAFDETWRWRWRSGEERFNHFWTQAVRATAKSRVTRIEVKTDKQTAYRRNEPMRITVRFPDDAAPPAGAVKVQLSRKPLQLPGRPPIGEPETQTLTLSEVEQPAEAKGEKPRSRQYETLLTRTPEGEYTFTLTEGGPPGLTHKPRAEARVLPPPGERDRLEMNRGDLMRAAAESRGKFYTLADADKVIDDLPEAERVPLNQPCPPLSVWNHGLLFLLLVLLLGCEWWVRRRERLV